MLSDQYAQISVSRRPVFDRRGSGHEAAPLGEGGRAEHLVGWSIDEVAFGVEVIVEALSDQMHRSLSRSAYGGPMPRRRKPASPFRCFNSSPEVIRLAVLMYVKYPLSLRNVEDLLHERGIDICHETVRFWWNRFGPLFAGDIRRQRANRMRGFRQWQWHLDEMYVKVNGEMRYLWRAVDHEGERSSANLTERLRVSASGSSIVISSFLKRMRCLSLRLLERFSTVLNRQGFPWG